MRVSCSECGHGLTHIVTALDGEVYYQCSYSRCGAVVTHLGVSASGKRVAYVSGFDQRNAPIIVTAIL